MLRRKIDKQLEEWKNREDKLPLIVKGARQVGKTTSIVEFANNHYKTIYHINFFMRPSLAEIFSGDLDADTILTKLSFRFPSLRFSEGNTLIFLDEIQHCPQARTALKFLANDSRFDVVASGSLLGINYKDTESFPVGYTEELELMSLDFEEFLWANDIADNIIEKVRDSFENRTTMDPFFHKSLMDLFKLYIVIGGMPAAVSSYMKYKNYQKVLRIQRGIIADYKNDIVKYASKADKQKIVSCFNSITTQLSKDYKKFQFSVVEKKSGARKYGGALNWLKDAGIISFCYNLSRLELPLEAFKIESEFKVYMNDTGLLISMYEDSTADSIMNGNLGLFKGAIYENIVAECLRKSGHWLYYYAPTPEKEIDFILNDDGKVLPLEVKAGENTRSRSLKSLLADSKYSIERCIRLSAKNIGDDEKIAPYPLYMAFLL